MNINPLTIEQLRHSAAEVMACALLDLFPDTQLLRGGLTNYGFFYEAVFVRPINQNYIQQIEERIRAIVTADLPVRSMTMMRQNAVDLLRHNGQHLRAELLAQGNGQFVEIFQIDEFCDPAPAPYIESTKQVAATKILSIQANDRNERETVTRIEGIVSFDKSDLKKQVKLVEEAKKRDHRLLGPSHNLFGNDEMLAPGCWLWHPRGTQLRNHLLQLWYREHENAGFEQVSSGALVNSSLMHKAGCMQNEELYLPSLPLEHDDYFLAPSLDMLHALQYKSLDTGKKVFPVKIAECREVFSGIPDASLDGLIKTRSFTADQATIFCNSQEATNVLISSLQFIVRSIRIFDFESEWVLHIPASAKFAKSEAWQSAIKVIREALEASGLNAQIAEIQAPFQGPSLEASYIDSLGCKWPGPRVAVNVLLPARLGLTLEGKQKTSTVPTMITQSLFGSLERFIALLIEHWAGAIPSKFFESK